MIHQNWKNITAVFALLLSSTACLKDFEPTPVEKVGYGQIEITDAPIDDPNVSGVFLTISDVKVDGKSWAGFDGKTTFDLLAYHNGLAKLLGEGSLDIKVYDEIVLVFDTEADANGNSPGCYVRDSTGSKRKLNGGSQMVIKVKGSFEPKAGDTTRVIIDMDLRKSIVYQVGTTNEYKFVSDPELASAIRLLDKSSTGTISGDCTDGVSSSDKVVVYAYKKATFDINIEKFPQGASQVQFKNAVASSAVEGNGNYHLSLLESGLYELHFISYQVEADGRLYAKGELQVSLLNTLLDPLALDISAKESLSVDLMVTGILFF
ncbi:MAG: DUF4382 domain-containing protein [Saprospiraceae bacterium]|nr:DUF4382 domain-containing protein [Saprospiraceae bacterium]